jgi:hypothetical protein
MLGKMKADIQALSDHIIPTIETALKKAGAPYIEGQGLK